MTSHMTSPYGQSSAQTPSGTPTLSAGATGSAPSMWQSDNLGMTYSAQTPGSRPFGFSPPQSGQIMTQTDAAAAAAAAYARGAPLSARASALGHYPPYMGDFNAWSNFSNMALQGFRQTVDHGELCFVM